MLFYGLSGCRKLFCTNMRLIIYLSWIILRFGLYLFQFFLNVCSNFSPNFRKSPIFELFKSLKYGNVDITTQLCNIQNISCEKNYIVWYFFIVSGNFGYAVSPAGCMWWPVSGRVWIFIIINAIPRLCAYTHTFTHMCNIHHCECVSQWDFSLREGAGFLSVPWFGFHNIKDRLPILTADDVMETVMIALKNGRMICNEVQPHSLFFLPSFSWGNGGEVVFFKLLCSLKPSTWAELVLFSDIYISLCNPEQGALWDWF